MNIEPDHSQMKPGDILEYRCPRFGIVWQWRVIGIYLGAERQEGLVEVSPILATPGAAAAGERVDPVLVPEPMTRCLTLVHET